MEAAASSAIPTLGDTAARRVAVAAPPFFPNAGRGTVRFWGNEQGPTVLLWDGLDEEERKECERTIQTLKNLVVWSRARPMKGDCAPRGFEHVEKIVFCGKANRSKKDEGEPKAEEGLEVSESE